MQSKLMICFIGDIEFVDNIANVKFLYSVNSEFVYFDKIQEYEHRCSIKAESLGFDYVIAPLYENIKFSY